MKIRINLKWFNNIFVSILLSFYEESQFVFIYLVIKDENTQVLIDTDNEEEFTSSGVSEDDEDEEEEEEEENMSSENNLEEGKIPFFLDK